MVRNVMRMFSARGLSLATLAVLLGVGTGVARAQSVDVGDATGAAGSTVAIPVSWTAGDPNVAIGLTIDINFADHAINAAAGKPDCTFDPTIKGGPNAIKTSSSFAFRPGGCTFGTDCVAVRAGIIDFGDNNATVIPSGPLYTCNFTIPTTAAVDDTFEFTLDTASYVDVDGNSFDVKPASSGGVVRVGIAETPTPTETATPEVTPTNTSVPVTATRTRPVGGGGGDDDGCQVVASGNGSAAWLLLFPAAVLLWQRRRSR